MFAIKYTFMRLILLFLSLSSLHLIGQDFDYYHIGDTTDVSTSPSIGICLMGGATENDDGSTWFLEKADGGNVVVIRASGSDGYNDYFYNQLGVSLQSVETIVFNNASASQNSFVQRRIQNAEAIWIAGGDQFLYESYWKGGPIEALLNAHVNTDQAPIGGTSAGMAILGEYYFNAENGTVTSADALNNPFDANVTVRDDFLSMPFLANTITDTHYDNPDRKGRHAVFIAHMITENNSINFGIASDEYVAICIDALGQATVFGEHPTYEDFAYFLRTNCDKETPSGFTPGQPLTWDPTGGALEVCVMPGTTSGQNIFDLNTWENLNGGTWESWSVSDGSLTSTSSTFESCNLSISENVELNAIVVLPNPAINCLYIHSPIAIASYRIITMQGKTVRMDRYNSAISTEGIESGVYLLQIQINENLSEVRKIEIRH